MSDKGDTEFLARLIIEVKRDINVKQADLDQRNETLDRLLAKYAAAVAGTLWTPMVDLAAAHFTVDNQEVMR